MRAEVGVGVGGFYIAIRPDSETEASMLTYVKDILGLSMDVYSNTAFLRQPPCSHTDCARWKDHPELCQRWDGSVILRKRGDSP